MQNIIFEVKDKTGRKIRLTQKQWSHINKKHPAVANHLDKIKETLERPDTITESDSKEKIYLYYRYHKFLKSPYNYILVVVKYLNGNGFVISAYFERGIK